MHIVFRTLCFTAFLIFFTTLAIYFQLPEQSIATKSLPETKEKLIDLNDSQQRVKRRDLPKLLSSLLDDQNRAKSSGYIYIKDEGGEHGIYKVGRTTNINKRLKQCKRKCKKRLRLVKKFFVEGSHELCESMVHLELKSKGLWWGYLFNADLDTIIEC